MAKFTCPFCIREYDKSKVLYVCPDCGTETAPGRFAREPIKCKNSACGGLATLRKCPSCGEIIPKMALETPNLPFSIVGVSNSGKTNYITVMLHELGHSSGLRLALGHQTKATLDHQNTNYYLIYKQHTIPEATRSGESMPQIWYIKNLQKRHAVKFPHILSLSSMAQAKIMKTILTRHQQSAGTSMHPRRLSWLSIRLFSPTSDAEG